jgi:hypothetical protein
MCELGIGKTGNLQRHDIEELYSNLTSEEVEKLASEILEDEGDPLVSLEDTIVVDI